MIWPEDDSPYQPVARLRIEAQASWSDEGVQASDEGMAFARGTGWPPIDHSTASCVRETPHTRVRPTSAASVNEAVRTGKIDEIALAAPAHVLHDIREALDKAAIAKLGKTLSKDYTNTPDDELAAHFA